MKINIVSVASAALLFATVAQAQTSHYSPLEVIRENLVHQARDLGYSVEMNDQGIRLLDPSHHRELASLRQLSDETIVITGIITHIDMRETPWKNLVRQKISDLNVSSPVGTLVLDGHQGAVVMSHYLSASTLSAGVIANVVMVFAEFEQRYAREFERMELAARK
jgi:hypothetical protein